MRSIRLLSPLALLIPLVAASPASAADVSVLNYQFRENSVQIQPGESVNWHFLADGHTTTSDRGEWERWNKSRSSGEVYSRTFTQPGRYDYICIPHQFFNPPMRGVIQVGADTVAKTVGSAKAKVRGGRARLTLALNEDATVTWAALKGPSKKRKLKRRYRAGKASRTIKRLKPGRYTAAITAVDRFDKKSVKRVRFRIKG
jgi:plastocyanin